MSNRLVDGWAFRVLTVVDQFSREWPLLEADFSLSGKKVAACLKRAGAGVGLAESDHGGQRLGVLQPGHGCLGLTAWSAVGVHPARPTCGEQLH